jgi:5-methylcytosine-specific restriction endonuclease McrA
MRDYNLLEFKAFRQTVRNRDGRKCRWLNCKKRSKLQVHHILPWSRHPNLRYNPFNGITLCKTHHKLVTGNEYVYAPLLSKIVHEEL